MKLGITVVYFVKDNEGWLIDLHLKFIRKYTDVPYKIYAAANRLLPEYVHKLHNAPDISICPCESIDAKGGAENSFYQDQLFRFAIEDGATHIAVFHVDSFPVKSNWANYLRSKIDSGYQLAAIERLEENDHKPHSSFMFFPVSFYLEYKPTLRIPSGDLQSPVYQRYAKEIDHVADSGAGFGFMLYKEKLKWYPIKRSNKNNDHRLFAGIYGDLIFHVEAAGFTRVFTRTDKLNYQEKAVERKNKWKPFGKYLPFYNFMEEKIIPDFDNSKAKKRIVKKNIRIIKRIKQQLFLDPERYLDYLRGK
jgi:hypothetical protein